MSDLAPVNVMAPVPLPPSVNVKPLVLDSVSVPWSTWRVTASVPSIVSRSETWIAFPLAEEKTSGVLSSVVC